MSSGRDALREQALPSQTLEFESSADPLLPQSEAERREELRSWRQDPPQESLPVRQDPQCVYNAGGLPVADQSQS